MPAPIILKIKKKPFQFFILKLVILFAIIFVLDFSIGHLLKYLYFHQKIGYDYRTTYSIEQTKADLLIFGSSRANHHYRPDIFEKYTHLSYYNVGRDGNFIFYHYAVLKGILKRYSPKVVILDFIDGEFRQNQDSYDRISTLLPYYDRHPEMRSIIELKSRFEKIKLLSSIYPYNSLLFSIITGNTKYHEDKKMDIEGYIPLTEVWNGPMVIDNSPKYKFDTCKIRLYKSFIHDCKKSKVRLYIVCSPYYMKSTHKDGSISLGEEIAQKNNVLFLDYSADTTFVHHENLFADVYHLNDDGAKIFTLKLIRDLSKTLSIHP